MVGAGHESLHSRDVITAVGIPHNGLPRMTGNQDDAPACTASTVQTCHLLQASDAAAIDALESSAEQLSKKRRLQPSEAEDDSTLLTSKSPAASQHDRSHLRQHASEDSIEDQAAPDASDECDKQHQQDLGSRQEKQHKHKRSSKQVSLVPDGCAGLLL